MTKKNNKQKQPHRDICGATAKSTGEPCKLPAGFGTDHVGTGKCKYHGGASKGPGEKNKNAVKTGEYETIWLDTLDDKEQELYREIRVDVIEQLDNEIRLTDIRIRRMMMRISLLKGKKTITANTSKMTFIDREGNESGGNITENSENTLMQIQNIEEALTRVQSRKSRLLKLKHQIESGQGPIDIDITNYINALKGTAEEVWGDEE